MVVYKGIVKVTSLVVNLLCSLVVPVVENVAYKLSIGGVCECPSPLSSPSTDRSRKRKKLKNNSGSSGTASNDQGKHHHHHQNDVKRIKLLLDITVAQNGSQVLDIQASTRAKDPGDAYRSDRESCPKKPGFILRLLNLPSTILFYIVNRVRQLAHDLEALEEQPRCDSRIKKSPKRRITRGNYRKIIPFFPFNLLGFSNYSAFQMPSITRSSSSTTTGGGTDEKNNLNGSSVSVNGKSRSKRPRNSSTEDENSFSDLSDEEISYLELPESLSSSMLTGTANISAEGSRGHDEVDSDETAETIKKKGSSSSSEKHPLLPNHRSTRSGRRSSSRRVQVHLNASTSEDNCGNVTTFTDLDSSGGVLGEERRVEFTFIKELNEAANESYNSCDDPDYVPPVESESSSTESSFATDKGCSDESLLAESVLVENGVEDKKEDKEQNVAVTDTAAATTTTTTTAEQNDPELELEAKPVTNGTSAVNGNDNQITSTTPTPAAPVASTGKSSHTPASNSVQAPAPNSSGGKGKKKKNKNKQNGTPNNGNRSSLSTGNDEEYKTPEEGENEGLHHF